MDTTTSRRAKVAVWREPGVGRLLAAGASSSTGRWAYSVGLPAFVYDRTHSVALVALVAISRYVPALLLTPVTALLARRRTGRALFVACDLLACAAVLLLAVFGSSGMRIGAVIVLAAVCSTATRARTPIASATLLDLIDEDLLVPLNVATQAIESASVILGPLIATGLLVAESPTAVFAFTSATFVLSALLESASARVADEGRANEERATIWRGLRAGFGELVRSSETRTFSAFAVASSALLGVDTVLLVVFANHRLGHGTAGYGLLLAGLGAGGLIGAVFVDRIEAERSPGLALVFGLVCYAVPTIGLLPVHTAGPAVAIEVLRGVGSLATAAVAAAGFQRAAQTSALASGVAAFHTVVLAGLVAGVALTPVLVGRAGLDGALLVAGIALPAAGLLLAPRLAVLDRRSRTVAASIGARVVILEQLSILERARRSALERLASSMQERSLPVGSVVIREGDTPDLFYVLVAGEVAISKSERGADHFVARVAAPGYFGEIGFLHRVPRTATVTASTPIELLCVEGEEFLAAMAEGSPSPLMLETLVSRLGQLRTATGTAVSRDR